jgi:hypothetical protein
MIESYGWTADMIIGDLVDISPADEQYSYEAAYPVLIMPLKLHDKGLQYTDSYLYDMERIETDNRIRACLTSREVEVYNLMRDGYKSPKIAKKISKTEVNVRKIVQRIRGKIAACEDFRHNESVKAYNGVTNVKTIPTWQAEYDRMLGAGRAQKKK